MIGYYVHHHGSGHLARAANLARAYREPVVALSSLPEPAGHPFAGWVRLADDPAIVGADDPTGGGTLHWTPLNSSGYRDRMAAVSAWVTGRRPRLVVVDVSAEVVALVRLLGTPVVTVVLPGDRDDPAHRLAHRLASAIVAPWPAAIYAPRYLESYADKTVHTGAMSRFDELPLPCDPEPHRVLVLLGAGGASVGPAHLDRLRAATGWTVCGTGGGLGTSADVHAELSRAQVVVAHAGLNSMAEVAALQRPCLVFPQHRPFGEQAATAAALHAAGIAACLPDWPADEAWPGLLTETVTRGGDGWRRWNDGRGASRFAAAIAAVAGAA